MNLTNVHAEILCESTVFTMSLNNRGYMQIEGTIDIISKKCSVPQSTSELYRPSDSRLSAELVSTSADKGFHLVSVTDPYGRNLGF
jgi:hypothetical protein